MSREVRKVPKDWEHPKQSDNKDRYKALYEGSEYQPRADEFLKMANEKGLQEAIDWEGCPNKDDFMPSWSDEEKTHLMMYETTSEGTPISPAFEKPEELAHWLADNGASSFGSNTATYEQWLRTVNAGWAMSAVGTSKGLVSGVEFISDTLDA